jgi:AcrR family transcriptional regulator
MTVEYSGSTDPEVVLPLLWRHAGAAGSASGGGSDDEPKPQVGRKPRLSIDEVVAAATAIADAEGLGVVSMTRVASSLNVGAMTLYTYVTSKAVLLDLMVDEVLCERDLPGTDQPRPDGWRAQIALYVERTGAMHHRHPWLRHVSTVRPPIGPGFLAEFEYVLGAFAGTGLEPRQMMAAANTVVAFVNDTASSKADAEHVQRTTGQSNDAWWNDRSLLWEKYFDTTRFPTMAEVHGGGGCPETTEAEMAEAHEFGLERLLDGIQMTIDQAARDHDGSEPTHRQ